MIWYGLKKLNYHFSSGYLFNEYGVCVLMRDRIKSIKEEFDINDLNGLGVYVGVINIKTVFIERCKKHYK